jgi:hypothetical protein
MLRQIWLMNADLHSHGNSKSMSGHSGVTLKHFFVIREYILLLMWLTANVRRDLLLAIEGLTECSDALLLV